MNLLSFLYRNYAYFMSRRPKRLLGLIKFNTLMSKIMLRLMNIMLPMYFRCTGTKTKYKITPFRKEGERIIVSLTSFPVRIGRVWLTIETILRQTVKPDHIILWLSKEQFSSKDILPHRLLKLEKRGLKIQLVDGDIRSYKKYYYSILEYPNENIILVDDDFFYETNLVESLMKSHSEYPKAICARYGYDMKYDDEETISKYNSWTSVLEKRLPSKNVFFGSGGGTLIRKDLMYKDLENIELARELCPTADDIFLNAMAQLNNTPICFTDGLHYLACLSIKDDEKLADLNIGYESRNDKQIHSINNYYSKTIGHKPF